MAYMQTRTISININNIRYSPHGEHQVLQPKTSKPLLGQVNFSGFFLELYKNIFKDMIRTSKFKFSFRGLLRYRLTSESDTCKKWACIFSSGSMFFFCLRIVHFFCCVGSFSGLSLTYSNQLASFLRACVEESEPQFSWPICPINIHTVLPLYQLII